MITALRLVTTRGTWTSTFSDPADFDGKLDETVTHMANLLGSSGDDVTLTANADGVGWVAFNPRHIIAVEFVDDTPGAPS